MASELAKYVSVDPDRLWGEPVFVGTRVPIKSLFNHIKAGDSLDVFLEDFPGVQREAAEAIIELAGAHLLAEAGSG